MFEISQVAQNRRNVGRPCGDAPSNRSVNRKLSELFDTMSKDDAYLVLKKKLKTENPSSQKILEKILEPQKAYEILNFLETSDKPVTNKVSAENARVMLMDAKLTVDTHYTRVS